MRKILPILLVVLVMLVSCGRDKINTDTIILNFNSAENYAISNNLKEHIGDLGQGNVNITLDSVFMKIPSDEIEFSYRKGATLSTERGIAIYSSVPGSNVFTILGTDARGNYFCELYTGDRVVIFDVSSIDEN